MLDEAVKGQWQATIGGTQRSIESQSQSYYRSNTELLGTKDSALRTKDSADAQASKDKREQVQRPLS